jgi:hypothetical protein
MLWAALNDFASGTRLERERGAGILLSTIFSLARRHRAVDPDEIAQAVLESVLRHCVGGVPTRWPNTDEGVRRFLSVSVRNRINLSRRGANRTETLDGPAGDEATAAEGASAARIDAAMVRESHATLRLRNAPSLGWS